MVAEGPELLEYFAANIRRLRIAKPFTQKEIANALGVDERYVQRIERAQINVGLVTVAKFANVLEVPPSELLLKAKLPSPKVGRPRGKNKSTR